MLGAEADLQGKALQGVSIAIDGISRCPREVQRFSSRSRIVWLCRSKCPMDEVSCGDASRVTGSLETLKGKFMLLRAPLDEACVQVQRLTQRGLHRCLGRLNENLSRAFWLLHT